MLLFPERLKMRHGRMQSEKAVEVEHGFPGDVDGRTHGVVTGLAVRYDDVEAVGCSALEDHYQALAAVAGVGRAKGCARQKARQRSCANYGQRAVAKKNPSRDAHKKP